MCGIIGIVCDNEDVNVNQFIFDGLTVLQHRGQDAAGMVTTSSKPRSKLELRKDNGLVKEVFQQEHMAKLMGNLGLGHVRYPTAGTKSLCAEAQPLYTNYPHGLCIAHNGTLTNTDELRVTLAQRHRHINTGSDSEVLLNVFATELEATLKQRSEANAGKQTHATVTTSREDVFEAARQVVAKVKGGYAVIVLVAGVGLLGFRDPNGIRPLVYGTRVDPASGGRLSVLSSESVALDALGTSGTRTRTGPGTSTGAVTHGDAAAKAAKAADEAEACYVRDVAPGEAVLVGLDGAVHTLQLLPPGAAKLTPCIFEYVYFARPDSVMDEVPVYESRLRMGERLAQKIMRLKGAGHGIDVVIPIPDTSRASALQCAYTLGCPFREGFIKNRYIARTFIMPGQAARKKSVRLKLNTIKSEFTGKNVLLVDDSIVRGTTAREIVDMAREAGPKNVYFVSAAPAIKFPNVYGIDIPTRTELIAHERSVEEVAKAIGVDWLIYQDLADLEDSVKSLNPKIDGFESSCFSGSYVTPEIDEAYLEALEASRNPKAAAAAKAKSSSSTKRPPPASPSSSSSSSSPAQGNAKKAAKTQGGGGEGCEGIPGGVGRSRSSDEQHLA